MSHVNSARSMDIALSIAEGQKKPSAWNVNSKCFVFRRAGHLQKDCKTKKGAIAGTALEEEPATEKFSETKMLPQHVNSKPN